MSLKQLSLLILFLILDMDSELTVVCLFLETESIPPEVLSGALKLGKVRIMQSDRSDCRMRNYNILTSGENSI